MSTDNRKERRAAIAKSDEGLLAELGYKQEFQRAFTPLEVFGIAFSIVGLLPSIASVLFYSIPNGGPVAMVWGWAVASVFILIIGLSMAELASAAPTSGGLYFWAHTYSSPEWRNLLAWIVGYANTIGSIASVSSIDWGAAVQIMAAAGIGSDESFTPTSAQTFGVYVGVVLSHAVLCCLGTRVLARLQNVYVALNILLCFVVIIALPIATPNELKNSASYALGNFTNLYDWPNGFAFILSFLAPLWTICSFDSSVHISEEASNAATAVPWAIIWAISIAGILGLVSVNVVLAFCMGQDLEGLTNGSLGQPMAQIFLNSFGKKGTLAMWSFIILAQYMMGSSMMLAASRQSFAFARDGALPFSGWLYRMNSFTKTPVNTVWFCAAGTIALGALVFAGTQAINAVFAISITALYVAYSIPIAARWIWRKENGWTPGTFSLGAWSGICAFISVTWMMFVSIVFFFPTTKHTNAQDMNYTVVVLGGVLILSLAWYYFPVYGGVHWFEGPVPNVDKYVTRQWAQQDDEEGKADSIEQEKKDIGIMGEVVPVYVR
ncbi:amino acid/polyamine transporter I [Multifurca ochricompacta]|uniref:Amino acid/polyamine transporter I n=1 Tax=Multifurca ochricompacta TaxID=376703 RepID=A0AAD4QJ11_9AGAM|nr:amino acid/polyamine transporter I [Multifurca ochricompacta]